MEYLLYINNVSFETGSRDDQADGKRKKTAAYSKNLLVVRKNCIISLILIIRDPHKCGWQGTGRSGDLMRISLARENDVSRAMKVYKDR